MSIENTRAQRQTGRGETGRLGGANFCTNYTTIARPCNIQKVARNDNRQ